MSTPHEEYRERLYAPASWWLATAAFAVTCAWIVVVISSWTTGIVAFAVVLVAVGTLVGRYGSLTLTSDSWGLRAGPALLPPPFVGVAEPLHRDEYRRRLGVEADVRAHLVTRPWLDRGVLVPVDDPADPVPYWLISSRHPDELAASINAHRSTHEGTSHGEEVS